MERKQISKAELDVLDFATDKRLEWETNHQLYSVIFEITPKCNFNCVHCYLHDNHVAEELSYQEIVEIIDILYDKEVLFLTLTGGEIFCRKDFLDIYLYAKKKGFIVELYSNGYLINQDIINTFKKYPPLLVDISLYGSSEETYRKVTGVAGAYERVIDNISRLKAAGIRVSVKTPVLNVYYNELEEIKAIAERFDIPFRFGLEIFPTIDNDDKTQHYRVNLYDALKYEFSEKGSRKEDPGSAESFDTIDLMKERPLFRCKLGRASCAIDYEGRMCPCMSFRHAGVKLTEDNIDEVWESFSKYPRMRASQDYLCLSCEAYDYCDICPAMMESIYGDLEHIDRHFCQVAKARYRYYEEGVKPDKNDLIMQSV